MSCEGDVCILQAGMKRMVVMGHCIGGEKKKLVDFILFCFVGNDLIPPWQENSGTGSLSPSLFLSSLFMLGYWHFGRKNDAATYPQLYKHYKLRNLPCVWVSHSLISAICLSVCSMQSRITLHLCNSAYPTLPFNAVPNMPTAANYI